MQSVAYNLLSSRQDAEECTNDALLDLWNTVPPGAPENVELYCIMLVRRRALDRLRYNRAQKRCATVLPLDELQETLCEPMPDDGELPAVLNTFLYALPDRDRRLFLQRYWLCRPIADIAAELPGAVEFTEKASKLCTVSIAHTDCTYEEASAVFDAGASHLTHLYNAMPGIHHRKPGPIGAGSERGNVVAELISDGYHIHPSAVRMAFRLFPGRICLISDALRCCGMPDGQYTLGGQDVFLKGGVAKLADGTIAGSAANLYECMQRAVSFGIPAEQAILSATIIPAREIGQDAEIGSIAVGKLADFVVCDAALNRSAVYLGGQAL